MAENLGEESPLSKLLLEERVLPLRESLKLRERERERKKEEKPTKFISNCGKHPDDHCNHYLNRRVFPHSLANTNY